MTKPRQSKNEGVINFVIKFPETNFQFDFPFQTVYERSKFHLKDIQKPCGVINTLWDTGLWDIAFQKGVVQIDSEELKGNSNYSIMNKMICNFLVILRK